MAVVQLRQRELKGSSQGREGQAPAPGFPHNHAPAAKERTLDRVTNLTQPSSQEGDALGALTSILGLLSTRERWAHWREPGEATQVVGGAAALQRRSLRASSSPGRTVPALSLPVPRDEAKTSSEVRRLGDTQPWPGHVPQQPVVTQLSASSPQRPLPHTTPWLTSLRVTF